MDRGEVDHNTEVTKIYHLTYVRNSRAVCVVWAIFTICFAILDIVCFIQPQWIGDTEESSRLGYFGLYKRCDRLNYGADFSCQGSFFEFRTIPSDSFRAATFLVGISALLFLICVICLMLFFFLNTATVLRICGWMQIVATISLIVGCVVYPSGWDHEEVKSVCGPDADSYNIGRCGIRWAYILAIVLVFDGIILATLALVLAEKQARLLPEVYGPSSKSELNGYGSDTLSKRSTGQHDDRYSDYSHRSKSRHSDSWADHRL